MIALTCLAIALCMLAMAPGFLAWAPHVEAYTEATEQDMGQDWGDLWDDLYRDIRPKRVRAPRKVPLVARLGLTAPRAQVVQLRSMRTIPTCMQGPHVNDG